MSSPGAYVILLVLPCGSSYIHTTLKCPFYHVIAPFRPTIDSHSQPLAVSRPTAGSQGHQSLSFIAKINTVLWRWGTCLQWRRGKRFNKIIKFSFSMAKSNRTILYCDLFIYLLSPWIILSGNEDSFWNEPPHVKTNKMTVCQAKTQISLGIRPVWSESSLCTQWVAKDPSFLHADSEDSDQTGLIWGFVGRTVILLVLLWGGSNLRLK